VAPIHAFHDNTILELTTLADGRVAIAWNDLRSNTSSVESYAQIVDVRQAAITLSGTAANDQYIGTDFGDGLAGAGGTDMLRGEQGNDTLDGGLGDDVFSVDEAGDTVIEAAGQGSDTVTVNTAAYALNASTEVESLVAGSGALNLTGSDFANAITGNSLSNQIWGLSGDDRLTGASGNDRLYGGAGNDQLRGEAGRDGFVFDTRSNKRTNEDKGYDFPSKDDTLHLDNKIFTQLGSGTASKTK